MTALQPPTLGISSFNFDDPLRAFLIFYIRDLFLSNSRGIVLMHAAVQGGVDYRHHSREEALKIQEPSSG